MKAYSELMRKAYSGFEVEAPDFTSYKSKPATTSIAVYVRGTTRAADIAALATELNTLAISVGAPANISFAHAHVPVCGNLKTSALAATIPRSIKLNVENALRIMNRSLYVAEGRVARPYGSDWSKPKFKSARMHGPS